MIIIAIAKDEELTYGTIAVLAPIIGYTPATVRRWFKNEVKIIQKKNYTIFLRVRHERKISTFPRENKTFLPKKS